MYNFTSISPINSLKIGTLSNAARLTSPGFTFFCMLNGQGELLMDSCRYQLDSTDIIYIRPGLPYQIHTADQMTFLILTIEDLFLIQALPEEYNQIYCCSVADKSVNYNRLRQLIASIALAYFSHADTNWLYVNSSIYQFAHYLKTTHTITGEAAGSLNKSEQKKQQIQSYLQQNYHQPLSLHIVAKTFQMTPPYTASFFKTHFGMTFLDYLNQIRLEMSLHYLKYSNEPVSRIYCFCGFPNQNAYLKLFKSSQGCSPDEYRVQYKQEILPDQDKYITYISNPELSRDFIHNFIPTVNTPPELSETLNSVDYIIDTRIRHPMPDSINALINLGVLANFGHLSFREQLKIMQLHHKFRYGRVYRIFESIKPLKINDQMIYDFNKLYKAFDFCLQINLIPLIELGNKPVKININSLDHIRLKPVEANETFYKKTLEILPHFLRGCLNRYGYSAVSKWRFELWTEHLTLFNKYETANMYARHFKSFYLAIKKLIPECKIGGPGYNTFAPISQFEMIMDGLFANQCPPDFITAYLYPYIEGKDMKSGIPVPMLSPDPNILNKRLDSLNKCIARRYSSISELMITEYSSGISSRNYINDSCYQATFLTRFNLLNLHKAQGFGYFIASDIALEYRDSNHLLFGGNGLLNRNGIPKASCHAYYFLSMLGDKLIQKGDNYIVTSSSNNSYQIIIFSYTHLNEAFCSNNTEYTWLKNPTAVFEQIPSIDVTLTLTHMEPGKYVIKKEFITSESGNLLGEWLKMGAMDDLRQPDIEYLKDISHPKQEIFVKKIKNSLEITCRLAMQEIYLYRIDYEL